MKEDEICECKENHAIVNGKCNNCGKVRVVLGAVQSGWTY